MPRSEEMSGSLNANGMAVQVETNPPVQVHSISGGTSSEIQPNEASTVESNKRQRRNGEDEEEERSRGSRKHHRRKHSKKSKKHKSSKDKKKKKHKHSRKEEHKKDKRHSKRRSRSDSASSSSSSSSSSSWNSSDSDDKNERASDRKRTQAEDFVRSKHSASGYSSVSATGIEGMVQSTPSLPNSSKAAAAEDEDDDDTYGPRAPLSRTTEVNIVAPSRYGEHLLAGEGEALAEFIKRNERIPRRGEVGWDGEQITQLEDLGYVMSGSRHKKMEAVRKRKENQIFSAEEKRLLVINETKKRLEKEAKVVEELQHLIRKKEHEEAAEKL